jgi:tripeptide aminopeptidase
LGVGIEPLSTPTRGGTDGSRLTERGVPTPNLFTGMQNIHGPSEWVSVQDMARAMEMCIALLQLWTKGAMRAAGKRDGHADLPAEADLVDWAG